MLYDTDNDGQFIMSYKCFYLIFNEIPIPDQTTIIKHSRQKAIRINEICNDNCLTSSTCQKKLVAYV